MLSSVMRYKAGIQPINQTLKLVYYSISRVHRGKSAKERENGTGRQKSVLSRIYGHPLKQRVSNEAQNEISENVQRCVRTNSHQSTYKQSEAFWKQAGLQRTKFRKISEISSKYGCFAPTTYSKPHMFELASTLIKL